MFVFKYLFRHLSVLFVVKMESILREENLARKPSWRDENCLFSEAVVPVGKDRWTTDGTDNISVTKVIWGDLTPRLQLIYILMVLM